MFMMSFTSSSFSGNDSEMNSAGRQKQFPNWVIAVGKLDAVVSSEHA
jgi:hypothetical protein